MNDKPINADGSSDSNPERLEQNSSTPPSDDSSSSNRADEPTRVSGTPSPCSTVEVTIAKPTIDGYRIHEEIHHGGQGIVFRATQLGTKRQVALKVLLEGPYASRGTRQRFAREVELAASLKHPSIVTILDSGINRGRCHYAMEYIDGVRLGEYFKNNRPALVKTLTLLAKVCDAVNFAHQRGVIHRDLKPSNILVDNEGQPHILDFGLAKARHDANPEDTTIKAISMTGQVLGTLAYMSPEQAAGAGDVDLRSDVYSLGVIAYETLLGRSPYPVDGPLGEVLNRIARDDPLRPRSVRFSSRFKKQIDDELETILLKSLEKDVNRRYQTAGDLARDIRHYLSGEPIEAKRASGLYMLKKTLRRYRLQAATAGLILAMLITFMIVFALQYRQERSLREHADQMHALAMERAQQASEAEARERLARQQAERDKQLAEQAAEDRRRALVQQEIQRGDLALLRDDLSEARDSYWDAFNIAPDSPAALWALRQYYLETGDTGAKQLYVRSHGPTAISPDGFLAAVCDAPNAITLREIESGKTIGWFAAPGPVLALSVDEQGRLVATGQTWARLWKTPDARPEAVVEFTRPINPISAHVIHDGNVLLIIDETYVWSFRCDVGSVTSECSLSGDPVGTPVFSPSADQLAIPTTIGVELVTIQDDGLITLKPAWTNSRAGGPRAVRFIDEDTLAILADQVYIKQLDSGKSGTWKPRINPADNWNMFDLANNGRTIAFGSSDGHTAVYHSGRLLKTRRITHGRLANLRLTPDGGTLITLDDQGSVTRWDTKSATQQRRTIHPHQISRWAVSQDGTTVMFADTKGYLAAYSPDKGLTSLPLDLPSLFRKLAGPNLDDLIFTLNEDGSRALIIRGNRIWMKDLQQEQTLSIPWRNFEGLSLTNAALSADGQLMALCGSRDSDDRQMIFFKAVNPEQAELRSTKYKFTRRDLLTAEFVGSAVNEIAFIPGSTELLAARTNGELLRLSPNTNLQQSRPEREPPQPRQPWTILESPAYRLAFTRDGQTLAVACDDGFIHLLALADAQELGRVNIGRFVNSISFNADDTVLMVCNADGDTSLYDHESLKRITKHTSDNPGNFPLATWIGDEDALLLADGDRLYETRPATADLLIEKNRIYAIQRQVARSLRDYEYDRAWDQAEQLGRLNQNLGHDAQVLVLDQFLQLKHGYTQIPKQWSNALDAVPELFAFLRLGHAAYTGGYFELAQVCLQRASQLSAGQVDAYTAWRLTECEYLLGHFDLAADDFAELVQRADFDTQDLPRAYLQWLAALALADRPREVADNLQDLTIRPRLRCLATSPAMAATQVIGRSLLERGADRETRLQLQSFFRSFEALAAPYRDDIEFIAGELARKQGRTSQAALRYQRCIDLAADDWPANWARYRLMQLRGEDSQP